MHIVPCCHFVNSSLVTRNARLIYLSFPLHQENRRHARVLKKASKHLELLEIVAMKGLSTAGMEEPKDSSTPTEDKDIAVMTSPSSMSSSSGASTSGEAPVPGVRHEPMAADFDEAVSRDAEDSQMPGDDL